VQVSELVTQHWQRNYAEGLPFVWESYMLRELYTGKNPFVTFAPFGADRYREIATVDPIVWLYLTDPYSLLLHCTEPEDRVLAPAYWKDVLVPKRVKTLFPHWDFDKRNPYLSRFFPHVYNKKIGTVLALSGVLANAPPQHQPTFGYLSHAERNQIAWYLECYCLNLPAPHTFMKDEGNYVWWGHDAWVRSYPQVVPKEIFYRQNKGVLISALIRTPFLALMREWQDAIEQDARAVPKEKISYRLDPEDLDFQFLLGASDFWSLASVFTYRRNR
jgi:hypothetical protein